MSDQSDKDEKNEININIGRDLSGKQVAIGSNITQIENQTSPETNTLHDSDGNNNSEQEMQTAIRKLLVKFFSVEEMKLLTFDLGLGLEYEKLRGESMEAKCLALISNLARNGQLNQLIEAGKKARPNADWPTKKSL